MATNLTTELAIRDVARHALAAAVRRHPPEWQDYPDIGEQDWAEVVREVERRLAQLEPPAEKYGCAYRHLADRASQGGLSDVR
jgi:hypothetical protein